MKKVKVGKIDIAYQWDGLQDGPVLMMSLIHISEPTRP